MVSWSRAEDSEEARHVIDSNGKVCCLREILETFQVLSISFRLVTSLMYWQSCERNLAMKLKELAIRIGANRQKEMKRH